MVPSFVCMGFFVGVLVCWYVDVLVLTSNSTLIGAFGTIHAWGYVMRWRNLVSSIIHVYAKPRIVIS